jgi:hypothetical protein
MNGSTENRASGAPEKPGGYEVVLSWETSQQMLPLVQRIVDDLLGRQRRLDCLLPEKDRLDRRRRTLAWPERSRRYQLHDEIASEERQLQEVLGELAGLKLILVDAQSGQVGFPTVVNGRQALFSWRPGDDGLKFWHYHAETHRRVIPAAWTKGAEAPRRRK